jgi:hypothetical protein
MLVLPIFWTVAILPPISILGEEAILSPRKLQIGFKTRRVPDTWRRIHTVSNSKERDTK